MTDPAHEDARAMVVRASLSVGAVETEYLRAGAGPPVVILDPWLAAAVHGGTIPDPWRGHRLIVPMHATIEALAAPADARTATPFDAWMRGLLDGLGLTGTTVVVGAALEREVRRFGEQNPGEIARIVLAASVSDAAQDRSGLALG